MISQRTAKIKVLVIGCLMFCAWFANNFALAWVHDRFPPSPPLPDLFYDYIPELPWALKVAEFCIFICTCSTIAILLLSPQRYLAIARVFYIAALLYLGRAICVCVTNLPMPTRSTYCEPRLADNNTQDHLRIVVIRTLKVVASLGLESSGLRGTCGDLIYSGHTLVLVVAYNTARQYLPKSRQWVANLIWVTMMAGMLGILASRLHYTIDVILAYYFSSRVFYWYHVVAANGVTIEDPDEHGDCISRVIWFPFIRFIEGHETKLTLVTSNNNNNNNNNYKLLQTEMNGGLTRVTSAP